MPRGARTSLLTRVGRSLWPPRVKRLTAIVALASYLFVMLLAAWPELHEAFHGHDADWDSHQCVATLLAKGQVLVSDLALAVPLPPEVSDGQPIASALFHCPGDVRMFPARAPPCLPA